MFLTNSAIRHTDLRGISLIHRGSIHVNSAIIVRGTNSVVPRVRRILVSHENPRDRTCIVPRAYPTYTDRLIRLRSRMTLHYVGPGYPTRVGRNLSRFISHGTVGVDNLNIHIIDRVFRGKLIGSMTSLCGLARRSLCRLSGVGRGSTGGVIATVSRDHKGSFRHLLFNLNVHRIKTGTTTDLTTRFRAVSQLVRTAGRRVVTIRNVNSVVTSDMITCFRLPRIGSLVRRFQTGNIGLACLNGGGTRITTISSV